MHRQLTSRVRGEPAIWCAFGLAAVAVAAYAVAGSGELQYGDEREYLTIADNIVGGRGFATADGATASRPPTWPLLLVMFRLLGAPLSLLALLPVALLVLSALLARSIGGRIAGAGAGWLCAFAVLLYPMNVYTAATLYPQALATALLLGLLQLGMSTETGVLQGRRAAAVGLLAVLLVYAVPTMVFSSALIVAWIAWRSRRRLFGFLVPAVLVALLPIGMWTARNAVVFDSFVPVSTATGVNLLLGNSEDTTANSGVGTDISRHYEIAAERGMGEVETDAYMLAEARQWVTEHPGQAGRLFVAKTWNYFAPYNEPVTPGQGTNVARAVSTACFGMLMALALTRLLLRHRLALRPAESAIWTLFLCNAPFMAIAFTRARFRQPLDTLLIVEAAIGLTLLLAALAGQRSRVPDAREEPMSESASLTTGGRG